MIKFNTLPIEQDLNNTDPEKPEEGDAVVKGYRDALLSCRGLQYLLKLMRDCEVTAMRSLYKPAQAEILHREAGKLELIAYLRSALAIPPDVAQEAVQDEMEI